MAHGEPRPYEAALLTNSGPDATMRMIERGITQFVEARMEEVRREIDEIYRTRFTALTESLYSEFHSIAKRIAELEDHIHGQTTSAH